MTRTITQIKVWTSSDKKEHRIYVDFDGSKQSGCLYLTGNRWQPKGTLENMDAAEKKAAWQIVQERFGDNKWHTIWSNQMNQQPKAQPVAAVKSETEYKPMVNRHSGYCYICGEHVAAGAGELTHLTDEEDIDFVGRGSEWLVQCGDHAACKSRHEAAQAERKAEQDAEVDRTWNALSADEQKASREAFWNEFFERTAYIGS